VPSPTLSKPSQAFSTTPSLPLPSPWQADGETAPGLIEAEFSEVETFTAREEFLAKAATYTLWFNAARRNSDKGHTTPWEIIHERDPTLRPQIATLPPVFLAEIFIQHLDATANRGYDVVPYPAGGPHRPVTAQANPTRLEPGGDLAAGQDGPLDPLLEADGTVGARRREPTSPRS